MYFNNGSRKPLALVDMDNTGVNFTAQFRKKFLGQFSAELLALGDSKQYWIQESFPEEYHKSLDDMICQEGFFSDMEPIDGAIEAVLEMMSMGIDVFICTAPHPTSKFCVSEKIAWIQKYLGETFVQKTIVTFDKTLIYGDVLIDDKPEISGLNPKPSWQHVIFHAPYNVHLDTPHRLEFWKDWKEVVLPILESKN